MKASTCFESLKQAGVSELKEDNIFGPSSQYGFNFSFGSLLKSTSNMHIFTEKLILNFVSRYIIETLRPYAPCAIFGIYVSLTKLLLVA